MAVLEKKGIKIGASILNSDFLHLEDEIKKAEDLNVDFLHLDIMDGLFVPNISIGPGVIRSIRKATDMFFDVHLMITKPDRLLDSFIEAGADSINVHVEECKHLDRTIKYIKDAGKKAAVALNPATPLSTIENVLDYLDMVLVMTVNPGFGGQDFIEGMLDKISRLKTMVSEYRGHNRQPVKINIQVDGGINEKTAGLASKAGADMLVMGSAIYLAEDPKKVIENTRKQSGFTL